MFNVPAKWQPPNNPAGTPTAYHLDWVLDGSPYGTTDLPASTPLDSNGNYNADFNSCAVIGTGGSHTLVPGDTVACTGYAVDATNNKVGVVTTFANSPVTIPNPVPPAPGPLVNASISVVQS